MKGIFCTTQSDLLQHNGKIIETILPLTETEADLFETGPMHKAELETGETLDVFEDEIIYYEPDLKGFNEVLAYTRLED